MRDGEHMDGEHGIGNHEQFVKRWHPDAVRGISTKEFRSNHHCPTDNRASSELWVFSKGSYPGYQCFGCPAKCGGRGTTGGAEFPIEQLRMEL